VASNRFFQFNMVPYPLWRKQFPRWTQWITQPLFDRYLAAEADRFPPVTAQALGQYLHRWGLAQDARAAAQFMRENPPVVEVVGQPGPEPVYPRYEKTGKVRLPAQWEPMESILLTWPILYPALWEQHAQMTEAIAPVATVCILLPSESWASAVHYLLRQRGRVNPQQVRYLILPTDDIWVRDYGPVVGLDAEGEQVCVNLIFDPLPLYPQQQDDRMPLRWAAHEEIAVRTLDLHLEGGNIWSDGQGTIIMAAQIFHSNPGLTRTALLNSLHAVLDFEKLILLPRLEHEETGHVDLLVKLADAETVLVSEPTVLLNDGNLRLAAHLLRESSNAAGKPYNVLPLPTPPLYLNWLVYPVWRSYTNALTVNGRVLVPVFDVPTDEAALRVYAQAMPQHEIIPIQCAPGANGGGAVHCLTKEIPAARRL
jgi:agmatine deiminase